MQPEINNTEEPVTINNGAPYQPPKEPTPLDSNNNYYASVLGGGDIISNYLTITKEYRERGKSAYIENLENKLKAEQNDTRKMQLAGLLSDEEIDKTEKMQALAMYVEQTDLPVSLKEKYTEELVVNKLTNQNVTDEELEQTQSKIEIQDTNAALEEWNDRNMFEKKAEDYGFFESLWSSIVGGFKNLTDVYAGLEIAMADVDERDKLMATAKAEAAAEEMNNIPTLTASDIQRIAEEKGLIAAGTQIPSFILESIAQAGPQMAIPLLVAMGVASVSGPLAPITGFLAGVTTYGIQQFGNFVNTQALVREHSKDMDIKSAGVNAAISAPLGFLVDKFITMIKFAPKGTLTKTFSTEIAKRGVVKTTAQTGGKGSVRGFLAEGPTEMFEAYLEREQAGLSLDDDEAWDAYFDAGWAGAAAGSGIGAGFSARRAYKDAKAYNSKIDKDKEVTDKINASPSVTIKHNSPVSLTMAVDENAGNNLIVEGLVDTSNEVGNVVYNNTTNPEFTTESMLFYLNNNQSKFFQTDTIGYGVDTSILHTADKLRSLNLLQQYFPEGDRAGSARYEEITEIVSTINNTTIDMIPARTFSYMDPTATGVHSYLTFRKNATEDFPTLLEAAKSFIALGQSIEKNKTLQPTPNKKVLRNGKIVIDESKKTVLDDVTIVEVDENDTGKVRTISKLDLQELAKNPEAMNKQGKYRIVWNRDQSLYDAFEGGQAMKQTFSDRYPQGNNLNLLSFSDIQSNLYSTLFESKVQLDENGNLKRKPTLKDSISPYMAFDNAVMNALFSQDLAKEAFYKSTFERLNQVIKEDLTINQQKILSKILLFMNRPDIVQERIQTGRNPNMMAPNEINAFAGGKLTPTAINKLTIALSTYRQVVDEMDNARQRVLRADLQSRGYNEQFTYIDDSGTKQVMAIKETFNFHIGHLLPDYVEGVDPRTGKKKTFTFADLTSELLTPAERTQLGIALSNANETFTMEVYDFVNKKAIKHEATHSENQDTEKKHYLQDKTRQQIYKLNEAYTDENGNKYLYGVFGSVKPQPLPKVVSPQMEAYVPTLHKEGNKVARIKTRFRLNGRVIDFSKNPELAIKYGEVFNEATHMFTSEVEAKNMAAQLNEEAMNEDGSADYFYYNTVATELEGNGAKNDNEIRRYQLKSNKQRTSIKYELDSDPYSSLIENIRATNQQYLDVVGIGQLKAEFVRAIEASPDVRLRRNQDSESGIGRVEDSFPNVEDIIPIRGKEKVHSHFLRLHNKIKLLELGRQRGVTANIAVILAEQLDKVANMLYTTDPGRQQAVSKYISKKSTEAKRNAGAVVGSVMKPVTTFWILMRPVKQLMLQSMASLGPIAVISNGNPYVAARLYVNAIKLIATRISNQKMMREGKGDIQKIIDTMYNEKDLSVFGKAPEGEKGNFNYTRDELTFIDQWMRKSGLSNVQDHVYNHGIGWSNIPELGTLDKTNLNPLTLQGLENIGQAKYGLLNPMMYLGKMSAFASKYGFEFGESINRDLFAMVALQDFRKKNPNENWKSDKNMSNIMIEANKLAGGMNNTMAFGWQSNFGLRVLGLFSSFSQKMSQRYFDPQSTTFTAKQRTALAAADMAIYGTLLFNLQELIRNMFLESEDEDARAFGEKMAQLNGVSLLYNYVAYMLTGENSEAEVGGTFGVMGPAPLGPISVVIKGIAELMESGTVTPAEHIAALAFYKNIFGNNGSVDLLFGAFGGWEHTLTIDERFELLGGAAKKIAPFMKQADRVYMGLAYGKWEADFTKTGQETGLQITSGEAFAKVFGIQNTKELMYWRQMEKNSINTKHIQQEAKNFLEAAYIANNNTTPDLLEFRDMLVAHKFYLDNKYAKVGMQEHKEFSEEVFRLVTMQRKDLVQKFYEQFTRDFNRSQEVYSGRQIEEAATLAKVLGSKYPRMKEDVDSILQAMRLTNEAYEKENN
jgi:hypothetical protein